LTLSLRRIANEREVSNVPMCESDKANGNFALGVFGKSDFNMS
jgi:hypothetical protein